MRCAGSQEAGFTLIEVLVAVLVLCLASVGVSHVVTNAGARLAYEEQKFEATRQLQHVVDAGAVGEGSVQLASRPAEAQWRVDVLEVRSGSLAGVPSRWVVLRGEIVWEFRGRRQSVVLERTHIEPNAASRL